MTSTQSANGAPRPIHVTLPPDDGINSWPYWQGAEEYRVKPGFVTKWGAWEYQFKISTCGRTHWFNAWHYTNRDRLMPGTLRPGNGDPRIGERAVSIPQDTNDAESRDLRAFTLARELQMGLTDKGYIEEAAQTIEWQRLEIERLRQERFDLLCAIRREHATRNRGTCICVYCEDKNG